MKAVLVVTVAWSGACLVGAPTGEHYNVAAEPAVPSWSTVTIPYAELRALWQAGEAHAREMNEPSEAQPPFAGCDSSHTGSGISMELMLPANAMAAQASGEDLVDCRVGPAEAGQRGLQLAWKTPDLLHRIFTLSYQIPQSSRSTNWVVSAEFDLQHESPLSWRVRLPAFDQLLTCQVNGHPVQPVHREPQELEFALAAPSDQTTRVAFSYAGRLPAMDRVTGSMSLEMPATGLFIHKLDWMLTLPELYETTALEGNVRIARAASIGGDQSPDSGHVLRLEKELVQGESPRAEVHYQRRGLTDGN